MDPEEKKDLSNKHPFKVDELQHKLNEYRKDLKPAWHPRKLKKAHPKYYGGNWSPGWC